MRLPRPRRPRPPASPDAPTRIERPVGPPPPGPPGPLPGRDLGPWLLVLLLLVIGGILAAFFLTRGGNDKGSRARTTTVVSTARTPTLTKVLVPKVTGLSAQAAEARLRDRKLASRVQETSSASAPRGTVTAQQPGAGSRLPRGATVVLAVSSGPPGVSVPKVTGERAPAAIDDLKARNLGSKVVSANSSASSGTVVSQAPSAGSNVARGTTVTLTVSKGPQKVAVPDVAGSSESAAVSQLESVGLSARVVEVPSDRPKGTVVAQSPAAGESATKGSAVRLNVSRGGGTTTATTTATTTTTTVTTTTTATTTTAPSTTTGSTSTRIAVPDLVGRQAAAAEQALESAALKADVHYTLSTKPQGQVLRQSPNPGQRVARWSPVRIEISSGPSAGAGVALPDVTGEDEKTATQDIQAAGFTVLSLDEPTSSTSRDGQVVDEEPEPGSKAPDGSQVTIYVGRLSG